jgi:Tol biopolymer transport system component
MLITRKSKLLLPILFSLLALGLPAAAQATLTYTSQGGVFVAADNGSGARKVAQGVAPKISPDGKWIAYEGAGLSLVATSGGQSQTLLKNAGGAVWSPDSSKIAAVRGKALVVIDVATRRSVTLVQGFGKGGAVNHYSFSPDGKELVYDMPKSLAFPVESDIFRISAAGGKAVRLTRDNRSQVPVWGPTGTIVFVKQVASKQSLVHVKNELFLMNRRGKQVKRLTHTKVSPLMIGLFPTDWSANGKRLLAQFQGEDTNYAVVVNPKTGAQWPAWKAGEQSFVGTALSSDGKTVLGVTGGFEPQRQSVSTVPSKPGGTPKVLVKRGAEPDWSR